MASHRTEYKLRNHPQRVFDIDASLSKEGKDGTSVTAQVQERRAGSEPFTYLVEFSDAFIATKPDFDGEMYLHTAISVIQSQIESHLHRSTRLRVHRASGLIETSPLKA